MKYKFGYEIYMAKYDSNYNETKRLYHFESYTSLRRTYNGLVVFLKKNFEYIKDEKPIYKIYEYNDNFERRTIEGGYCKKFLQELFIID